MNELFFVSGKSALLFGLSLMLCGLSACRDEGVNWERVDPRMKQELEKLKPAPETVYDGILHFKERPTDEELAELGEAGVTVRSVTGMVATARFPVKSLPLLTTRPYIIFISGPSEHRPSGGPE